MPDLLDLLELQREIANCRREIRNLVVMGLDPNQRPDQAALIEDLERSARAELALRWRALQYAISRSNNL
jgi:hypothetical protein